MNSCFRCRRLERVLFSFLPVSLLAAGQLVAAPMECAEDQEPTIQVRLSTEEARVAEPLTLEWIVQAPVGMRVFFPAVDSRWGPLEVLDSQDQFDLPTKTGRRWTRRLKVESLQSGELEIPALEITFSNRDRSGAVRSEPITLRIVSVLEEKDDPTRYRDVLPVVDVPEESEASWAWLGWALLGTVGATVAGVLIAWGIRRRNQLTPRSWAMQEIDRIAGEPVRGASDHANRVGQTAEVLKRFLDLQFGSASAQQTTEEFQTWVMSLDAIESHKRQQMIEIFQWADQAKFAGATLGQRECDEIIERARQLVQDCSLVDVSAADPKRSIADD